MNTLWTILEAVACPVGMCGAMGGMAWLAGKAGGGAGKALPRVPSMGCHIPLATGGQLIRRFRRLPPSSVPPALQTFVFADLAGFTAMTEAHGDSRAAEISRDFSAAVRKVLPHYGAEYVKSLGDGIMLRVQEPGAAVRLALKLVRDVGSRPGFPLVRVGVHTGSAVERDGDWYGAAVNLAARVAGAAGGGDVLVTEATSEAAGALTGVNLRPLTEMRLKNVRHPVKVFAVAPEGELEAPRLVIDPVCRAVVDRDRAVSVTTRDGSEVAFCSDRCARVFEEGSDGVAPAQRSSSDVPSQPVLQLAG